MESLAFYNVVIALSVLCMVTMIIHVQGNITFTKEKKHWFSIAFLLVALCALAECVGTNLTNRQLYPTMHYFFTMTEFCLTPFAPVCMSFACGIKKPAKVIGYMGIAHIFIEFIMLFFGGIFYITPDGIYHRGSFYFIYIIVYLVSYIYNLLLVVLISRNYSNKNILSVIATIITIMAGLLPSIADGTIRTAYICVTILMLLEYLYFESLYEQDLQQEISNKSEQMSMELIRTLSYALEAKDVYTNGHSMRVAEYSKIIAAKIGYEKEALERLHLAATLHDIGKIGVPDTVLNKPGKLTKREYNIIKMHTTIGADILQNIEAISYADEIARYHHERYDGGGYPEGIAGEDIPLEARIVAIADTYDAMTSKRVYRRKRLSDDYIKEEYAKNKGKQFDPELTDVFLELLETGEMEPIKELYSPAETVESRNEGVDVLLARDQLLASLQKLEGIEEDISLGIEDVIKAVEDLGSNQGAFGAEYGEFIKLFQYIDNICIRYNHKCFLVMVSIETDDGRKVNDEDMDVAMEAFDIAVRQTIRNVDICTRFNDDKYLIILVDSGEDNIKDIMERIINHYYKIQGRTRLEPKYESKKVSNRHKE